MDIKINITTPKSAIPLWQHREDKEVFGYIRSCASCPAVFVLKDDPHAQMDEQWQYYLRAINYNMALEDVFLILDTGLAFANMTGFRHDGKPKADYFHMKDLQYKPPSMDKVRTCSRSVLTGELVGDYLKVKTFDSQLPPPLKAGRKYPTSIHEVNPDDYLYLPQYNREMFLVANIVNRSGLVKQFPRGALYPWTGDNIIYTFVPHISNHSYGDVLVPLTNLIKLPLGSEIPSPYRFS